MTLPGSGSRLSFSQIEAEFGQNPRRSLGEYRIAEPNVGDLGTLGLDNDGTGGNLSPTIPISGTIRFSDFHGKSLNVVVNYWSGGDEVRPNTGYQRYQANNVRVIGGFRGRPNRGDGAKVYIHVNKDIGSDVTDSAGDIERCALKTGGNWGNVAQLRVDVGGSGRIFGAGGRGGHGGFKGGDNGENGKRGSTGLGINFNCDVHVKSGGLIAGGGGGGGGGGGATQNDEHKRRAGGGGGGGGAGYQRGQRGLGGGKGPIGSHFTDKKRSYARGVDGNHGSRLSGGQGGDGANNRNEAFGGKGGNGGALGQFGEDGGNGQSNRGSKYIGRGGNGGHPGDAIRRKSGNYNLYNNGTVSGGQSTGGIV